MKINLVHTAALFAGLVIVITVKTNFVDAESTTEGSTWPPSHEDDEDDSDSENSSGNDSSTEGSADTGYINGATSSEVEDFTFSNAESTTIYPGTRKPESCSDGSCRVSAGAKECKECGTKKETSKKGDYGTCEEALKDIQNVSKLLRDINEKGLDSIRGRKGDKGEPGKRGLPGSVFHKGQKGDKGVGTPGRRGPIGPIGPPGRIGPKGVEGARGPQGVKGPPGTATIGYPGIKGEKGECSVRELPGVPGARGPPGQGILQVRSMEELYKLVKSTYPGVIAYVQERGRFFGRVPKGWKTLLMQAGDPIYKSPRRAVSEHLPARREKYDANKRQRQRGSYKVHEEMSSDRPMISPPKIKWNKRIPSNLRLISLNEPWSGNMHGINKINYQCQKEAMEQEISGVFRAFLSTSDMNMTALVKNNKDAIVNLYNRTLFASWSHVFLTNKNIFQDRKALVDDTSSALYSFNGKNVIFDDNWDINVMWHGAHIKGRSSYRNCKNWTTNETTSIGIASDLLANYTLHQRDEKCDNKLIVLCIELPPNFVNQYFTQRDLNKVEAVPVDPQNQKSNNKLDISYEDYQHCLKSYYAS